MKEWQLDARLRADCHQLGRVDCGEILLMDNAHYPWFILVPFSDTTELHELDGELRGAVWETVDRLSRFVSDCFSVDKLNVAAIGNVVAQLHIHVVGRRHDDPCWPGVVWGSDVKRAWPAAEVARIGKMLNEGLKMEGAP